MRRLALIVALLLALTAPAVAQLQMFTVDPPCIVGEYKVWINMTTGLITRCLNGSVSYPASSTTCNGTDKLNSFNATSGAFSCGADLGVPTTLTSTTLQSDAVIVNYTAITGLAFTPAANTSYLISCFIVYTSTAAATGINFAWDVPAGAVIHMDGFTKTVATGANEGFSQNSDNVGTATSAAVATTENSAILYAQLRNGANATSTTLGFTPETANSVSVLAGSTCQVSTY